MLNLTTLLTADATAGQDALAGTSMYSLIFLVIMLIAFWFLLIRPQRKKEKQDAEMRKNIQIGDEIVSAGGIVGIVVKLEENTVVIETGSDRSKLRLRRWAISENLSANEEAAAKKEAKTKEDVGIEKE